MVSTPDPSTQIDYLLTVGQVAPVGVVASDTGDEWPDGVYTLVGGPGLTVSGTAVLDGDTLTLDWPTNVHADVLSQPYEVRIDGLRFINGQVKAAPGAASGTRTLDVTLNLGGPTIEATLVVIAPAAPAAVGDPDHPVLESADWWHRHGPHSTVLIDRGPLHEHGVYEVAPPPIPAGTYLLATVPGVQTSRPSVPHHSRLAFASGVRIIARAALGMVDGWVDLNGTGFSDVLFHQSTGTDGVRDAIEVGIRNNAGTRRFFVDNTKAGSADLNGDEVQDYSNPLSADQYFGVIDWMVEVDFPGGTQRRYRWYLPDPEGSKLTPGEEVEAWTLFDEQTRSSTGGFYINAALRWVLGDQAALIGFVRAFDLPTEDLALDFQASEATDAGWTDAAGNPWSSSNALAVVTAGDGIVLPVTTIPATAADPGAGSWSMAYRGVIDPARYLIGPEFMGTTTNIQAEAGWAFVLAPAEYGGVLFAVGDGTDYAAVPTGIDDCAKHTVVATVDRETDLLYVSVDGVELEPADISAVGTISGDDLATVYGTVIDDFALYGRALTLAERAAVSAELTT